MQRKKMVIAYNKRFELLQNGQVVLDHLTKLMWQKGGSSKSIVYDKIKKWVEELNENAYAGYTDWRLPALEEAMSLMETEKKHGDLYIDPIFDKIQRYIWTSNLTYSSKDTPALLADFSRGIINSGGYTSDCGYLFWGFIRAVRSLEST